ncbi:hypothetical protein Taro_032645, partial [Colocasia esculenta]|nr:hypothetical protein [Colocasia esculenta]
MSGRRYLNATRASVAITAEEMFSGASALVVLLGNAVHVRARVFVCVAGSVTPSVVTSSVGSPRFRGVVVWLVSTVLVWFTFVRGCETESFVSFAGDGVVSGSLSGPEMADRRDWEGGGDDPEDPTQRMIERIWESLTEIRMRMDQPAPAQSVVPVIEEAVPVAPVTPPVGVEVQQAKREQFRTLQQGRLSVMEYQMRFMALSSWPELLVYSLSLNATEGSVEFSSRHLGTSHSGCRCFDSSSACAPHVVHGAGSVTPSVVTSSVGSPRFR